MSEGPLEAREFIDMRREQKGIIRVAYYDTKGECIGRGEALILDNINCVAVLVSPCGFATPSLIKVGAIINYSTHPEAERRIVGSPAYVCQL